MMDPSIELQNYKELKKKGKKGSSGQKFQHFAKMKPEKQIRINANQGD